MKNSDYSMVDKINMAVTQISDAPKIITRAIEEVPHYKTTGILISTLFSTGLLTNKIFRFSITYYFK